LAYEVEALATGWRLGLHTSEWRNLVALAHRYEWKPTAGADHFLREAKQVVPASEARALAAALRRALRDLPPERRKLLRPPAVPGRFSVEVKDIAPEPDLKNYFAWERRWIVEEVIRLCGRGAVQVRPI
jgi:hypothetical protein